MISKLVHALVTGLIAAFVTLVILVIVSAILPGVSIDASWWAAVVGLLVGVYDFVTNTNL